ncbi:hypothetical protein VTL71DRAFT_9405 [Oculimacula yallundae]|uniref:Uncharacterized protein n=1 Tax=Oculimacula yallundae TaxID=86028 RepID=A0ABR4BSY7_9HELO
MATSDHGLNENNERNLVRSYLTPMVSERQTAFLKILDTGTLNDLAESLYTSSRLYVEAAKSGKLGKVGSCAMYEKMIKDSAIGGPRHAAALLHTIGKPVIRSIIKNTLAYDITHNTDSINDFLLPADNCAGAYVATIRVKEGPDKGKCLSKQQWKQVIGQVKDYLEIDPSPEQIDKAHSIEMRVCRRLHNDAMVRSLIELGNREFFYKGIDIYWNMLWKRLGPEGRQHMEERQIQAPFYVGCSNQLGIRIQAYDTVEHLDGVAKLWKLLLSITNVLEYSIEPVLVPIIRIWQQDQLPIAEIMLTMLASSLTIDGGLNCVHPGTFKMKDDLTKFNAAIGMLSGFDWIDKYIKESEDGVEAAVQARVNRIAVKMEIEEGRMQDIEQKLEGQLAGLSFA